jgi:hypothetical protein
MIVHNEMQQRWLRAPCQSLLDVAAAFAISAGVVVTSSTAATAVRSSTLQPLPRLEPAVFGRRPARPYKTAIKNDLRCKTLRPL